MNRTRVWLVVSPVAAAGVLIGHGLAYRLTSTPTDPFHAYLEHAPQVLLILMVAGVILAALGTRTNAPPARVFPLVGLTTFVLQEHIERLVHGGGVPMLLTSPAFVVGRARSDRRQDSARSWTPEAPPVPLITMPPLRRLERWRRRP